MTMRSSLAHVPSPLTDDEIAERSERTERRAWHETGTLAIRVDDPRVPMQLRLAAEAWGISRFGRRQAQKVT